MGGTQEGAAGSERSASIEDVRIEKKVVQVFNLEVANAHTFFVGADGALVHNGRRTWVDKTGRTQVVIDFPSRKAAKDAASRVGLWCNKPEKHKRGGPHFHDKNHSDPSKPNIHYDFPENQY